jgi:Cof subfamily protein (haloacid dehalogenase superfamily)
MSQAFRIVITDIDGTLLADYGTLPPDNRAALAHCRSQGVLTCLATGRRWTTCRRLLDRMDLAGLIDYCILNNGMLVKRVADDHTLFRRDFPLDLLLRVADRLNAAGLDPIVLGHNPDGKTADVFHRNDCLLNGDFIAKNEGHTRRVSDWRELKDEHLVELVLIGTRDELEAAAARVEGLAVETAILRNTYYLEYLLEITPRGVSKLLGADELLSHLGLSRQQAMAIGDSNNDLALLAGIPMSVAVANADPRVLAVAQEVTAGNAEAGFAQAVRRHIPGFRNLEDT